MQIDNIKVLLENEGIKGTITIGSLLDADCIGLFATAGQTPIMYFDNTVLEKPGIQVLVKNKSYEKAYETIREIYKILNKQVGFNPSQSPFYIGRSENGYAEFSVNYIVYIEEN